MVHIDCDLHFPSINGASFHPSPSLLDRRGMQSPRRLLVNTGTNRPFIAHPRCFAAVSNSRENCFPRVLVNNWLGGPSLAPAELRRPDRSTVARPPTVGASWRPGLGPFQEGAHPSTEKARSETLAPARSHTHTATHCHGVEPCAPDCSTPNGDIPRNHLRADVCLLRVFPRDP